MIEDFSGSGLVPSLFLVFAAGLLSFLSPCVLPLIPSYFSILGGMGLGGKRAGLIRAASGFILGFSAVFIVLAILVSATFSLMGGILIYINRIAGIIVIVLGLNVIFDFISFLNYEKRPLLRFWQRPAWQRSEKQAAGCPESMPAAFFAGAAFATGWTPCIGPILTAILLTAGQSGKTGIAACYLAVYSAGLALPFLLTALFFEWFLKHASRYRRGTSPLTGLGGTFRSHLPLVRRASGVLLIVMGLMILTGSYSALNVLIQKFIFSYTDWAQTKALPFRLLAEWLSWLQKF